MNAQYTAHTAVLQDNAFNESHSIPSNMISESYSLGHSSFTPTEGGGGEKNKMETPFCVATGERQWVNPLL